jgi:tRNA threonylcarbamoyladenosine biosynthesis protein TsaB
VQLSSTANPLILLLESATATCSVALARGEEILVQRDSYGERDHARMLAVFIQQCLEETGLQPNQLDAVAVSRGPGSYTGLRIGVATAKGICFSLDIPLLAVDTSLSASAWYQHTHPGLDPETVLVPVIDARRMEVYGAAVSMDGSYIEPVRAEVLHPGSFITNPQKPHIVFGDAATKCVEVYKGQSYVKVDTEFNLSACGLLKQAILRLAKGDIEDLAYFEPFYLKEYIAGPKPKP